MKILLIDNYDSFTYNLYHYLSALKCKVDVYRNDKIGIARIKKNKYKKIVISPGPGNPTQAGNCIKIVRYFYKTIPILGVCLGHQIIGQVFNSKIIGAKNLMHGKTSIIKHNGTGIFKNLPNPFRATRYHSLVVDEETLPDELIISARSEDDNEIMGLKHKEYNIQGIQCHPESILTESGRKLLMNFIEGNNEW